MPTPAFVRCSTSKVSRSGARPACPATSTWSARSTRRASTTTRARSPRRTTARDGNPVMATTDLAGLGLDEGGHLLVGRALGRLAPGGRLTVTGRHPALRLHLAAW